MIDFSSRHCEACDSDSPPITQREIDEFMPHAPGWRVVEIGGGKRLRKEYEFEDFARALRFANKVGEIAEQEKHHPTILIEYGKVTVTWWTRKINGLHVNDFIMVSRSDELV